MNDGGSANSRKHTMENHIRNSLSVLGGTYNKNIRNRPLWHSLIAGGRPTPHSFDEKGMAMYSGYADLVSVYSQQYGAGMVEFIPSNGMSPMNATEPQYWNRDRFYVNWHPGPFGHRLYAEMIAHFYLGAALKALEMVPPVTTEMLSVNETSEIFKFLEDPPYLSGLPNRVAKDRKCDPICTDAQHQFCIFGMNPKDHAYDLRKYVVDANGWKFEQIAGNPQSIEFMEGGQGSMDTKFGYKGNRDSGTLVMNLRVVGHRYVMVEKAYADKKPLSYFQRVNELLKQMNDWFKVQIVEVIDIEIDDAAKNKNREQIVKEQKGKILKCVENNDKLWTKDTSEFGCQLKFEYAGKYQVAFSVDTDVPISICAIASY